MCVYEDASSGTELQTVMNFHVGAGTLLSTEKSL